MPLVVVVAVFHRGDREHQDEWDEGAGHGDGRHCRVQLEELQHGKVDVARAVVRVLSVGHTTLLAEERGVRRPPHNFRLERALA
jgi:hypothetical protein